MKIGSIVIDCDNFDKMTRFWQEALGYVPGRLSENDFVILKDPKGKSPNVSVNRKDRPLMGSKKPGWRLSDKIRIHLDLYADDQEGEVKRLVKLGAKIVHRPGKGHDYVILTDPEGNHFCIIQT